jgi:hypothetical protein
MKTPRRIMKYLLPFLLIATARIALCDPRADLASPSQEVRDSAAKILRATSHTPPPREKWDKVMNSLHPGMTEADVMKILDPFHPAGMGGMGGHWIDVEYYKLDDLWILRCEYSQFTGVLLATGLAADSSDAQPVGSIPPDQLPDHFTGTRTIYWPDGQPFVERHYTRGVYDGGEIRHFPSGILHCIKFPNFSGWPGIDIQYEEDGTLVKFD